GSQVVSQIVTFQKAISETGADLKLVEAENIHITMRFLGEIPTSLVNRAGEELKAVQFNPFEVSLQGTGVFPEMRRINVIWVGIEKGVLELVDIHSQIESRLKKLGIRPDDRGFNPHITVARVRSARNRDKLAEALLNIKNKHFGTSPVDSIKLKKSILTPKGSIYTTITEIRAAEK
ncbi:MAG: RNA 2',3'-cyclic phosphodiesterase, partial [Candidatus Bathyarchaeota archaeon]